VTTRAVGTTVCVSLDSFQAIPVPDALRKLLSDRVGV
jgi:acyl-CoA thioesterase FadM